MAVKESESKRQTLYPFMLLDSEEKDAALEHG